MEALEAWGISLMVQYITFDLQILEPPTPRILETPYIWRQLFVYLYLFDVDLFSCWLTSKIMSYYIYIYILNQMRPDSHECMNEWQNIRIDIDKYVKEQTFQFSHECMKNDKTCIQTSVNMWKNKYFNLFNEKRRHGFPHQFFFCEKCIIYRTIQHEDMCFRLVEYRCGGL